MNLQILRVTLWGLAAGVAVALVAANAGWTTLPGAAGTRSAERQAAMPQLGGEFDLVDQNGARRTWADFRGKPVAVFFGFTHCPDICPTTLGELSVVLADLKERGDDLQVVLVSGDPARDTPAVLREYLQSFDPRIVGLTGKEREIEWAFGVFKAFRRVVPMEGGGYTVDHSAGVYLYDADGAFSGTLDREEPVATRDAKIRRLLDAGGRTASGSGGRAS